MYQWEYRAVKFYAQGSLDAGRINEIELEDILNQSISIKEFTMVRVG
jgi:hypothetical protein